MKKTLIFLMAVFLAAFLASCSGDNPAEETLIEESAPLQDVMETDASPAGEETADTAEETYYTGKAVFLGLEETTSDVMERFSSANIDFSDIFSAEEEKKKIYGAAKSCANRYQMFHYIGSYDAGQGTWNYYLCYNDSQYSITRVYNIDSLCCAEGIWYQESGRSKNYYGINYWNSSSEIPENVLDRLPESFSPLFLISEYRINSAQYYKFASRYPEYEYAYYGIFGICDEQFCMLQFKEEVYSGVCEYDLHYFYNVKNKDFGEVPSENKGYWLDINASWQENCLLGYVKEAESYGLNQEYPFLFCSKDEQNRMYYYKNCDGLEICIVDYEYCFMSDEENQLDRKCIGALVTGIDELYFSYYEEDELPGEFPFPVTYHREDDIFGIFGGYWDVSYGGYLLSFFYDHDDCEDPFDCCCGPETYYVLVRKPGQELPEKQLEALALCLGNHSMPEAYEKYFFRETKSKTKEGFNSDLLNRLESIMYRDPQKLLDEGIFKKDPDKQNPSFDDRHHNRYMYCLFNEIPIEVIYSTEYGITELNMQVSAVFDGDSHINCFDRSAAESEYTITYYPTDEDYFLEYAIDVSDFTIGLPVQSDGSVAMDGICSIRDNESGSFVETGETDLYYYEKDLGRTNREYKDHYISVKVKDGVEVLESDFIGDCRIESLEIPASVRKIEPDGMHFIVQSLSISPENQIFKSDGGCVLTKDGSTLIKFFYNFEDDVVYMPDGVQKVGPYALYLTGSFDYSYHKPDIIFGDGLEEISSYAFSCSCLENIVFPESLKTIEENAFGESSGEVYFKSIYFMGIPENISEDFFMIAAGRRSYYDNKLYYCYAHRKDLYYDYTSFDYENENVPFTFWKLIRDGKYQDALDIMKSYD